MDIKAKESAATPSLNWRNKPRRAFTAEQRLAIVRQTQVPGVSVAEVAQRNGINANLLFAWKRRLEQGLLPAPKSTVALVPVKVVKKPGKRTLKSSARKANAKPVAGTIEIELAGARIFLHGAVSEADLASTLRALARR